MKYQYIMNGMFDGADGETYEINVPSPYICDSEKETKEKNSGLKYKISTFIELGDIQLVIMKDDDPELTKLLNFEEFRKMGGYIRMLKEESKNSFVLDDTDFVDTDRTFEDIFSTADKHKFYDIEDLAYSIEKV